MSLYDIAYVYDMFMTYLGEILLYSHKQTRFLHIYTPRQGWLAADDWLRGAGTSVMQVPGNCGKAKVARGRKRCTNARRK